MAAISRGEYNALKMMFSMQVHISLTHSNAWRGRYDNVNEMSPEEFILLTERATPSVMSSLTEYSGYVPASPMFDNTLFNLAIKELLRRYKSYGREWMRAGIVETAPPEADV